MSSTGEKAGLLPLHERSSSSSPTGMDVDDETTQQTQSIHESQAHRLQGGSAKVDPLLRTHGTKAHGSTSESLLSGHHDALPTAEDETPRQVIAVSASKGPAAFFNLARKFLVTDEMCDLSALEGAIVSAVDAAHLLERSQLATIVRVQTSYVTVEPKRKKQVIHMQTSQEENVQPVSDVTVTTDVSTDLSTIVDKLSPTHSSSAEGEQQPQPQAKNPPTPTPQTPPAQRSAPGGRELRRARIVITVKRTDNYKQWLEENPLQAIIAGSTGDSDEDDDEVIS